LRCRQGEVTLGSSLGSDRCRASCTDPRARASDVHTLPPAPTADDVERLAAATGVTRFPIRNGDELLGYVHLKDVLDTPPGQRHQPLPASTLRALPTVAADVPLADAIETMRTRSPHMARVHDASRNSTTLGVTTLDDILASLTQA
jgi:CBS domain containing-hemolysin-like protein